LQIYLPIAEMPIDMFVVLGIGAAVGFISGMFGIGGGFLLTPALIFLGVPPAVVVATQAPQIAASSLTSTLAAWRKNAVDLKLGMVLLVGGLIGTQLGVMFFNAMSRIGQLDTVIAVSYVVLLGAIGLLMLIESVGSVLAIGKTRVAAPKATRRWGERMPWRVHFERSGMTVSILPLAVLALAVGFIGAVLGIGGGFIMVPALIYLFRVPTQIVVGTSSLQILVTMIAATILHAVTDRGVDLFLGSLLMVGSVFGAQFGARAGAQLRGEYFRLLLALLVFGVALRFGLDLVAKPEHPFTASVTETSR
jgi:uncharacterized membrane protein YfcA